MNAAHFTLKTTLIQTMELIESKQSAAEKSQNVVSLLTMFNFEILQMTIRLLVDKNNKIWAVAKDISASLGYKNSADAVHKHCEKDAVKLHPIKTLSGIKEMQIIDEGNIYRLISCSKLKHDSVVEFKRKVFDEILPSIRNHGIYISDPMIARIQQNPELIHQLIKDAEKYKAENAKLKMIENDYNRMIHRRTRYKFKEGSCFYIISNKNSSTENKIGVSKDSNLRMKNHTTSAVCMCVRYLCYTETITHANTLETLVKMHYTDNIVTQQNEHIYGVEADDIIKFVHKLLETVNIKYTEETPENITKYNESISEPPNNDSDEKTESKIESTNSKSDQMVLEPSDVVVSSKQPSDAVSLDPALLPLTTESFLDDIPLQPPPAAAPPPTAMRTCRGPCGLQKPVTDFYKSTDGKCKTCICDLQKQKRRANPLKRSRLAIKDANNKLATDGKRICTNCKVAKLIASDFYKSKIKSSWCKDCMDALRHENADKTRAEIDHDTCVARREVGKSVYYIKDGVRSRRYNSLTELERDIKIDRHIVSKLIVSKGEHLGYTFEDGGAVYYQFIKNNIESKKYSSITTMSVDCKITAAKIQAGISTGEVYKGFTFVQGWEK